MTRYEYRPWSTLNVEPTDSVDFKKPSPPDTPRAAYLLWSDLVRSRWWPVPTNTEFEVVSFLAASRITWVKDPDTPFVLFQSSPSAAATIAATISIAITPPENQENADVDASSD